MINHHNMIIGDNVVIDDSCMITPIEDGVIDIKATVILVVSAISPP